VIPRPTGRGLGLLGLAAGSYVAGRIVGTWELYLFAFAFLAAFIVSWLLVTLAGRGVRVTRSLVPERPVAGDEPDYSVTIRNASLLPGPQLTLRTLTGGLSEDDLQAETESMGPRGRRNLRTRMGRVNRGVHELPAMEAVAEDPLGLVRATHKVGEPMAVTVYPRVAFLRNSVLHPELGLKRDWAGQKGLLTPGASEFRGIRPHQPGEPLSHIDWKSTARTGVLMLREMEEPAGADITLLLDGSADQVVGRPPETNFELAVRAAGSIADYALRAGRGVTLICHEADRRQVRLTPDGGGRRALLETLAQAQANATAPLALVLRSLLSDRLSPLRSQSLTLVGMTLDAQMARALESLREDGVQLSFVYVPGFSFAGTAGLLPFLPPREAAGNAGLRGQRPRGRRGAAGEAGGAQGGAQPRPIPGELPVETRALLMQLSSAGVRCVDLAYGDDLVQGLSPWQGSRLGWAAAR
jgi:uncharacterized protein (DUF58 family)